MKVVTILYTIQVLENVTKVNCWQPLKNLPGKGTKTYHQYLNQVPRFKYIYFPP